MSQLKKVSTILCVGSLLMATPFVQPSFGQSSYNALETIEQRRQRHNAERYEQYRDNGYRAPLGGYREKLGDVAPRGTDRPGYTPSYNTDRRSGQSSNSWDRRR
jgi:hypothetical protein